MTAGRPARPVPVGPPGAASRIPVVTIWFWLIKVMITGADVAWPDYVYQHLGQVLTSGLICVALIAALAVQLRARRYRAWIFWPAMVAVSLAGTEAANSPHARLGLSYLAVMLLYLVLLIAIVGWWRARGGSLSLPGIDSVAREAFFWAASLAASALGTAIAHLSGDFSGALVPGGLAGLCIWATLAGCIAVAWRRFGLSPVLAFWSGCVLTRPLGTSLALWLAAGRSADGPGLGRWPVTAGLAAGVVIAVTRLAVSHRDAPAPAIARTARG
jgi:uncharacterized membrane-anchored protein